MGAQHTKNRGEVMYFLDTNTCIYFLNNQFPHIRRRLERISRSKIKIPSVVIAELYYGAEKSMKRKYNLSRYMQFATMYDIITFGHEEARIYGLVRATLEKAGKVIGGNDLMIASIVLAHDAILVTGNVEEFSRVDGIHIENWTQAQ